MRPTNTPRFAKKDSASSEQLETITNSHLKKWQPKQKNRRQKQLKLFSRDRIQESPFGGSLLKNSHAKVKRPFAPRATMHITLKTAGYGRMLKRGRRARVERIVNTIAKTNRINLIRFANVGNHLHLLLTCREKERLTGFLRGVSGAIARMIQTEERSIANKRTAGIDHNSTQRQPIQKFWLQRPWSRIVASSGRAFRTVSRYVDLNSIESWGFSRHSSILIWDQRRGSRHDLMPTSHPSHTNPTHPQLNSHLRNRQNQDRTSLRENLVPNPPHPKSNHCDH